jgi:hypothetical protein
MNFSKAQSKPKAKQGKAIEPCATQTEFKIRPDQLNSACSMRQRHSPEKCREPPPGEPSEEAPNGGQHEIIAFGKRSNTVNGAKDQQNKQTKWASMMCTI